MQRILALAIVFTLALPMVSRADGGSPMIVVGGARSEIGVDDVLGSPVMLEHRDVVMARANARINEAGIVDPQLRAAIAGSLAELPFHRILDIKVSFFSGLPDMFSACIEGHPTNGLAIEACAGTVLLLSALSANVKYRWDLVLHQDSSGHIQELSLGPGFGLRDWIACFDSCEHGYGADIMASLQYVFWVTQHFGIVAQLDLGATYYWSDSPGSSADGVRPLGKLSVGVAF